MLWWRAGKPRYTSSRDPNVEILWSTPACSSSSFNGMIGSNKNDGEYGGEWDLELVLNSRPEIGRTAEGVLAEEVNMTEVTKSEEQHQKPRLKNSKRDRKQGGDSSFQTDPTWASHRLHLFKIRSKCGWVYAMGCTPSGIDSSSMGPWQVAAPTRSVPP